MRIRSRPAVMAAGLAALLVGVAAPALAATAQPARAAHSTHAAAPAAGRTAAPNPKARHSGKVVPGLTGAAARKADPSGSVAQRTNQMKAAFRKSSSSSHAAVKPAASPALSSWSGNYHGYWGTSDSAALTGIQATQSVSPNLKLSSSDPDTIYSPTLYPQGAACIEITTVYNNTADYVGAWDWCPSSGFVKTATINASFLSTYTTSISGHSYYSVQTLETDAATNTWTSYLYNYTTSAWDTFYTSSGTSTLGAGYGGWDMNEVYTAYNSATKEGYYCSQAAGSLFESTGLEYQTTSGGAWAAATTSNSGLFLAYPRGLDLGCENSWYALPTPNSAWNVTNTTHSADELVGGQSAKCVDTNQVKFANGTKEQLYTCNAGSGQEWTYNSSGELTVDGGKYCLDVYGQGTADGTEVDLWSCNGGVNQQWSFSIKHMLVSEQSGKCLEAAGTGNGAQLEIGTCADAADQQLAWK